MHSYSVELHNQNVLAYPVIEQRFITTNPSKYSYHDDPNLSRDICLNKASSCLVLFTLTCAAPKP